MNTHIPWPRPAHALLRLVLCMLLLPSQPNQSSAEPVPTPSSDAPLTQFDEDIRLKRTVTINQAGISLDKLLQSIPSNGLILSCNSSCENWKLQLRLKNRPLRDLMRRLAELLPGKWEPLPDKTGYRLAMDMKAIAKREEWWRLFLQEREKAKAAQSAMVLAKMRPGPVPESAITNQPGAERSDPEAEEQIRAPQGFFQSLPAELQEQLSAQMNEAALYRSIPSFGTSDTEGAMVVRMTDLPSMAQDTLRARAASMFQKDQSDIDFSKAMVSLTNGGIALEASMSFPDGRWTGTLFHLSVGVTQGGAALPLDPGWLVDAVKKLGPNAPEGWKRLVEFEESRFWKNDVPPVLDRLSMQPLRRADVLRWLGDKGKIEFVADYYSRPCTPMSAGEKRAPLMRPLKDELDMSAAIQHMSWKRGADNIYLFRNNRWYRDDLLEVSASLLKKWQGDFLSTEQKIHMPGRKLPISSAELKKEMDWEAEVVTTLSRWQIPSGLTWAAVEELVPNSDLPGEVEVTFPFRQAVGRIDTDYFTSCFYSGLQDQQRAALVEQRLSVGALTEAQWQQAVYLSPLLPVFIKSGPLLLGLGSKTLLSGPAIRILPDPGPAANH